MSRHHQLLLAIAAHLVYAAGLLGLAVVGAVNLATAPAADDRPFGFSLPLVILTVPIVLASLGILMAMQAWRR